MQCREGPDKGPCLRGTLYATGEDGVELVKVLCGRYESVYECEPDEFPKSPLQAVPFENDGMGHVGSVPFLSRHHILFISSLTHVSLSLIIHSSKTFIIHYPLPHVYQSLDILP